MDVLLLLQSRDSACMLSLERRTILPNQSAKLPRLPSEDGEVAST